MDVFPKYIVENDPEDGKGNYLLIGKATYHRELAYDINQVLGGGWWDRKDDTITLHGSSYEFGFVNLQIIKDCILSKRVFTNPYSEDAVSEDYIWYYDKGSEIIKIE